MQLSQSAKFWLIFLLVLVAAFLGGVLGNWVFIYLLDKYYGIPGGNYLAPATTTAPVIVRDSSRVVAEQDSRLAQSVAAAESGFVRIFNKQTEALKIYETREAILTAAVITSDGWLVSAASLPAGEEDWGQYEAIASDRKRYAISTVVVDPLSKLTFIRLADAQNLTVRNFVTGGELGLAQTVVSVGFDSKVEVGRLSAVSPKVRSSDTALFELAVSDLSARNAYLYDVAGQMIGLQRGGPVLAMDAVEAVLESLLTNQRIVHARLGVNYLDLSETLSPGLENGSLLAALNEEQPAVVAGSPAEKAGLRAGDILLSLDDVPLNRFNPLFSLIQEYAPGETVSIVFRRGGEDRTVTVTLDELTIN